jgi:hypothetical protein
MQEFARRVQDQATKENDVQGARQLLVDFYDRLTLFETQSKPNRSN